MNKRGDRRFRGRKTRMRDNCWGASPFFGIEAADGCGMLWAKFERNEMDSINLRARLLYSIFLVLKIWWPLVSEPTPAIAFPVRLPCVCVCVSVRSMTEIYFIWNVGKQHVSYDDIRHAYALHNSKLPACAHLFGNYVLGSGPLLGLRIKIRRMWSMKMFWHISWFALRTWQCDVVENG